MLLEGTKYGSFPLIVLLRDKLWVLLPTWLYCDSIGDEIWNVTSGKGTALQYFHLYILPEAIYVSSLNCLSLPPFGGMMSRRWFLTVHWVQWSTCTLQLSVVHYCDNNHAKSTYRALVDNYASIHPSLKLYGWFMLVEIRSAPVHS